MAKWCFMSKIMVLIIMADYGWWLVMHVPRWTYTTNSHGNKLAGRSNQWLCHTNAEMYVSYSKVGINMTGVPLTHHKWWLSANEQGFWGTNTARTWPYPSSMRTCFAFNLLYDRHSLNVGWYSCWLLVWSTQPTYVDSWYWFVVFRRSGSGCTTSIGEDVRTWSGSPLWQRWPLGILLVGTWLISGVMLILIGGSPLWKILQFINPWY